MFKKVLTANNIQYFTLASLNRIDSVTHAFSARLALTNRGYEEEKNRALLCQALSINPAKLVVGKQVHSNRVAVVRGAENITADAFITDQPGLVLAVLTADCLPIIIIDKNRPAVSIVHAGRQGTLLRIVAHALTEMAKLYKTEPQTCLIGIGPGIGPCCYEIPKVLAQPFQESFSYWEKFLWEKRTGFFALDLTRANQIQLKELGVKGRNIFLLNLCTCCNPALFYSYRREKGESRRLLNLVMLH